MNILDLNSDDARLAEVIQILALPNRESTGTTWTGEQIRTVFYQYGLAFTAWEMHFGFRGGILSQLLAKTKMPNRGESHKAAVLLSLKPGQIVEENKDRREKMTKALGPLVRADFGDIRPAKTSTDDEKLP